MLLCFSSYGERVWFICLFLSGSKCQGSCEAGKGLFEVHALTALVRRHSDNHTETGTLFLLEINSFSKTGAGAGRQPFPGAIRAPQSVPVFRHTHGGH